ncbi:MAG: PEP-CTERM sorting domain-containing protein [Sedimentisphaerales bacterium]|jgi:hypothetical protein
MSNKKVRAQKNWLRTGMTFVALVVLSMAVVADASYGGPSWRGGTGTTLEQWSFSSSSTDSFPDSYNNTYGEPELWVDGSTTYFSSKDTYNGVWTLGTGDIAIEIPNNPNNAAGTEKHIWTEITWKVAGLVARVPDSLMVGVYPEYSVGDYTEMDFTRSDTSLGNGWFSTIVKTDIWPNPTSELITITGDVYIDEVTIDTQCIPEPATFGLLIGGAFIAIRRKTKGLR